MDAAASPTELRTLERAAREVRRAILEMLTISGSGHSGGSLSVTDLVTALLFRDLRYDPHNPAWVDRDRLVLSKGHAAPAFYAALAVRGWIPREELATLRRLGSRLQGHVDREKLPFVEASTGCLGQGIGMAVGMALDGRLRGANHQVYAILGDGECQAGPTWEALMAGGHFKLDRLTVIIDRNGLETDGATEAILGIEPLAEKLAAFRYQVLEIDGHNLGEILDAYARARATRDRPTAIVARTVKGKGVSFMEHQHAWHGKAPSREEAQRALAELPPLPGEEGRA
ncbi:MAG: transketolase [Thermoplasmata archaeon]